MEQTYKKGSSRPALKSTLAAYAATLSLPFIVATSSQAETKYDSLEAAIRAQTPGFFDEDATPITPPASTSPSTNPSAGTTPAPGYTPSPSDAYQAQLTQAQKKAKKAKQEAAKAREEAAHVRETLEEVIDEKQQVQRQLIRTERDFTQYRNGVPLRLFDTKYQTAKDETMEGLVATQIHDVEQAPPQTNLYGFASMTEKDRLEIMSADLEEILPYVTQNEDKSYTVPIFSPNEKEYLAYLSAIQTMLIETEMMYAGKDQIVTTRGMEQYLVKRKWLGQLLTLGLDPYKEKEREAQIPVLSERLPEPRKQGNIYLSGDYVVEQFDRVEDVIEAVRFNPQQMQRPGIEQMLIRGANKDLAARAFVALHGHEYSTQTAFEAGLAAYVANEAHNTQKINEVIQYLVQESGLPASLSSDIDRIRQVYTAGLIEFGIDNTMMLPVSQQMQQMFGTSSDGLYLIGPSHEDGTNPLLQAGRHEAHDSPQAEPVKEKNGLFGWRKRKREREEAQRQQHQTGWRQNR